MYEYRVLSRGEWSKWVRIDAASMSDAQELAELSAPPGVLVVRPVEPGAWDFVYEQDLD